MIAAISLLLVLITSMIVIRIASVALVHTGMGREAARLGIDSTSGFWRSDHPRSDNSLGGLYLGSP